MTDEITATVPKVKIPEKKLSFKTFQANSAIMNLYGNNVTAANPWSPEDIDRLEIADIREYRETVKACRFFYKRDPIASTIVNKMIDIAVTELDFSRSELTNNEEKIVEGLLDSFLEFAEAMTLEFLISGLVVPEIKYTSVPTPILKKLGIKKFGALTLPTTMWLRDPATVKINAVVPGMPSYYVEIPEKMIFFIMNKGQYSDGTTDPVLWSYLQTAYPAFIEAVRSGKKEFLLENSYIIRRRFLSDSPYPIPYLFNALESMKHKRNIRRMDYSIASRVITAIQLIKMGNDEYPLTEDDSSQLNDLRDQMYWRNTGGRDVERIFQLFTNHTVDISWVFPDVAALLNDSKYRDVNRDIFYALGFPAILVTGETERSSASDAEFAMLSPVKTMETVRRKILFILNGMLQETFTLNGLKGDTKLRFAPINLYSFEIFTKALQALYESGNISRTSYAKVFGYNLSDEFEQKEEEQEMIDSMDLPEFAPQPFSPQPGGGNSKPETPPVVDNKEATKKQRKKKKEGY